VCSICLREQIAHLASSWRVAAAGGGVVPAVEDREAAANGALPLGIVLRPIQTSIHKIKVHADSCALHFSDFSLEILHVRETHLAPAFEFFPYGKFKRDCCALLNCEAESAI